LDICGLIVSKMLRLECAKKMDFKIVSSYARKLTVGTTHNSLKDIFLNYETGRQPTIQDDEFTLRGILIQFEFLEERMSGF
jgi:hypothetical protein